MYRRISAFYCQPNPKKEAPPYDVGDLMHSLDYSEVEFKAYCHYLKEGNLCSKKIELGLKDSETKCTMVKECNFPITPFPQK